MARTDFDVKSKVDKFVNGANSLAEPIENASRDAGKKIGEIANRASERASHYVEDGRTYIRTNPYQGAALAAVAGIAVGCLFTLLARRSH